MKYRILLPERHLVISDLHLQGIPVHLDGARVFNAAEALGVPVADIARHVTSVQLCLSKVPLPPFIL